MRRGAREVQEICQRTTAEGESCQTSMDAFVRDVVVT